MRRVKAPRTRRYIHNLERFAGLNGTPVVRHPLMTNVLGRMEQHRIVLRTGLTLQGQLATLVHELTHFLIHCPANPPINRTVCEYEAEAVETWVCATLNSGSHVGGIETPMTDDLLACSVSRVRFAADAILHVARNGASHVATFNSEAQSAVELNAPSGEEVVFHDKLHRVGNFIGLA